MTENDTRQALMEIVERRAMIARVGLSALCRHAGLSYTIAYRWKRREYIPTLPTIGRLENALAIIEAKTA